VTDFLVEEALLIVKEARDEGIEVRLIGSVAVIILTGADSSDRPARLKDIDLISQVKYRAAVQNFLFSKGWELAQEFLLFSENRETYQSADRPFSLDVYYNIVDGNHRIRIGSRLLLSYPTITPTDLLMTKIQRVRLRPEDDWDACALLRMNRVEFDLARFRRLMGKNWGLYTTASGNLERLASKCEFSRAHELVEAAKSSRKSILWYIRSFIGPKVKWWSDVYEARMSERGDIDESTVRD